MIIRVKAFPKSKRNEVEEIPRTDLELELVVRVTAAPDKCNANKVIVDLVSKHLKTPKSMIELVKGETFKNKI